MKTPFGPLKFAGALRGALLLGLLAAGACAEDSKPAAAYDVEARRLDLIPAGTVIGTTAPRGWSHLILKSHPHPAAGDFRQLSKESMRLSSLLFTAIVSNVQADQGRHHLERVAIGMGTRIGDKDVIVTPETQKRLGADFGFVARIVLSTAQERLQDVQLVARSPHYFALIDAPGLMLRRGRHRPVVLRYAVLVEEATGKLDTLLWLLDRDGGGYTGPAGPMEWLPPNKIEDCVLHVDSREFTLGNPTEKAFAVNSLPRGQKQIPFSEPIRGIAAQPRLSSEEAADLEAGLRAALKPAER